jgi:hypothetical protein
MKKEKPRDFFVYKSAPFRVLYLGGKFMTPNKADHLWLFRQRNVARLMAIGNNCEYADFRDYIRIATGGRPSERSEQRKPVNRQRPTAYQPTLEELA